MFYEDDEVIAINLDLGIAVGEKTGTKTFTKSEIGEDDYFSWGYWESEDEIRDGAWISSKENLTDLENLNFAKAKYRGDVFGTAGNENIENGNIELDIDFEQDSLTGDIEFEAGKDKWSIEVEISWMSWSYIDAQFHLGSASSGEVERDGEVVDYLSDFKGNFNLYGENGERFGGGFTAEDTSGTFVNAAFKGEKVE
jgi:hypothetical protein